MKRVLILLVRLYQRQVSPLLPPSCRYHPTCSEYAVQALEKHGVWRGGLLAAGRVLRCHPFSKGGFDPVPEPPPKNEAAAESRQRGEPRAQVG